MNTYFLTGASGAVGSAIVPLLYADPNTRIRILLRAQSDEHLRQRFEELCRFWELALDAEERQRIEPLRGDASLPRFALADEDYAALCAHTTHIIHCAATVRMNEPLEDARKSALGSAEQILSLARTLAAAGKLSKVEFVSTVGVGGKLPGVLPERWIDEPREFHNTYEQSKAEAEELVRRAVEVERLPITVHRPSMVIGDSRDGRIIHFQIFYFICEFLSGRRTLGLYPNFGEVRLDVIPVDWVANAIAACSSDPATAGRIFHLCTGPELSPRLRDLKTLVRKTFSTKGLEAPADITLPTWLFAALPRLASCLAPADKRRALATLPIFLDYLGDQQGFANDYYVSWLRSRQRTLPTVGQYLDRVLSRYLESKYPSGAT